MAVIQIALLLFLVNIIVFVIYFFPKKGEKQKSSYSNQVIWRPDSKGEKEKSKIENSKKENSEEEIRIKKYNTNIEITNRLI